VVPDGKIALVLLLVDSLAFDSNCVVDSCEYEVVEVDALFSVSILISLQKRAYSTNETMMRKNSSHNNKAGNTVTTSVRYPTSTSYANEFSFSQNHKIKRACGGFA
jgi:hypothetical protein